MTLKGAVRKREEGLMAIVEMLQSIGGMTKQEITALTGRPIRGVRGSLKTLRDRGLIYVGRWERQPDGRSGSIMPVFFAGQGVDAPRLKPIGRMETQRRYRRRYKGLFTAMNNPQEYMKLGVWRGLI